MDGGVLMNQATHYVDMIQYLSEKKIKTVSAFGGTFGHKMECEDVISVNLKFEDGTIGNIQANTISFPENFEGAVTLFFEKATFRIGGKAMNKIDYWKGRGEKEVSNRVETSFDHIYGNSHFTIIKNMVEHLTKGKKLLIPGEQGLLSLRVIEAAYKSLSSNKEVII
jgi:UDP-N-acetyl-2-amino-2-deoxyglucuronate dehydrogenase